MSLRHFAWRYAAPRDFAFRAILPENPRMVQTARLLEERFGLTEMPPQQELLEIASLLESCAARGDYTAVTSKQWRKAPWCLWLKAKPLAYHQQFLAYFLRRIEREKRRSILRSLISSYLLSYIPEDATFRAVGNLLKQEVLRFPSDWQERQNAFNLFDADAAPENLAKAAITSTDTLQDFFAQAGFQGMLAKNGLLVAVMRRIIASLQMELSGSRINLTFLQRVLDGFVHDGAMAYPELKACLAEALLLPWRERPPPERTQILIQDFLLEHYKDPRLNRSRWLGIREEAQSVLLRWLTRESLRQFIEVVDETANPGHWEYRKAFWMYYLDNNHAQEAWVAFGSTGAARCRQAGYRGGFGQLKGALGDHAVLLMRMGDLVIADWSHNGTCRIWLSNNPKAPRLYQEHYHGDDLKIRCDMDGYGKTATNNTLGDGVRHYGSQKGKWQNLVSGFIQYHTGISYDKHKRF